MKSTNDHTEPAHDDCNVESILKRIQARNAERPAALESDVRCGAETDPRRARAAFMADPRAVLVVNGTRFFHRDRPEYGRRRPARSIHQRRPSCNTSRRGSGRPARRSTSRTTSRSSAASGDSGPGEPGPSDDDGLADRHPAAGVTA